MSGALLNGYVVHSTKKRDYDNNGCYCQLAFDMQKDICSKSAKKMVKPGWFPFEIKAFKFHVAQNTPQRKG